jgi:protein-tyrosine phosphatase
MKLLFVCLGNICRSPLAEGIFRAKTEAAGLAWEIDSAGTAGYHVGEAPHPLSQKTAKFYGIDISSQKCRQFKASDMDTYDRIYAMDLENFAEIKRISKEKWKPEKTDLLLNSIYPGKNKSVPDPWYGEEPGYHDVFKLIETACDKILEEIRDKR